MYQYGSALFECCDGSSTSAVDYLDQFSALDLKYSQKSQKL